MCFRHFEIRAKKNYKLDPAHFYTAPGLAWQALLKAASEYCEDEKRRKECKVCADEFRLELFTDIDMLLMVEKGIRGGISQAVKRYDKANNKYMKELCNPDEESICLQYLNGNNLYGWAMLQNLPMHGFKWKEEKTLPLKNRKTCQKRQGGISFRGLGGVSKRAAPKSQ